MSTTLQRARFTTAEYTRQSLAGRRTELIDGEIIEIAPIGSAHLLVVTDLAVQLQTLHAEMRLVVQQLDPVVEVWTAGISQQLSPGMWSVGRAGVTVPLDAVFDGLSDMPDQEA